MKSALFVDFDNVFSGLRTLDPAMAERFARQPAAWLHWLLTSLPLPDHAPALTRRRLLVRRVYLNPQVYQAYRVGFNHAGFEIVDCPAMTTHGKTSTDIHMVLDMVDLLQHEVSCDEFIVFSADADFTPVLRKLRRWDRRTTVLAVGFPSAAYRASADLLIDTDLFVREALGMGDLGLGLALGSGLGVAMGEGADIGPITVPAARSASPTEPAPALGAQAIGTTAEGATTAELIAFLHTEVARADMAVPCARLASRLMSLYPGLAPDWCGQGSFRRLLQTLPLAPLQADWRGSGGHLYDPARHSPPRGPAEPAVSGETWGIDAATLNLIQQVHQTTGVPLLSPAEFRGLLEATAADVAVEPFALNETGKRVRDRCREAGLDINRLDVNWVLRGLLLSGHAFGQGEDEIKTLSYKLVGNLLNLCRREQMVLDEHSAPRLQRWVSGRVQDSPSAAAS